MKNHLLIIDPQNDFVQLNGALSVPGAVEDMKRLANFVERNARDIDDIHVTLDSHREVDIAHPIFWLDNNGEHPKPFTNITLDDVTSGRMRTRIPTWNIRAEEYASQLAILGRYDLTIWPPHCIIGSWGHAVDDNLSQQLRRWERQSFAIVNYVTKGSNIWTEHYSAVKAEVEDPADPTTQLNTSLIDVLQDPEVAQVFIAGEALSHCVANTIRDIADNFGEENIQKFVLLEDCCSSVPGCEKMGEEFVREMSARGMSLMQSTQDMFTAA